jgi:hypothetical protein
MVHYPRLKIHLFLFCSYERLLQGRKAFILGSGYVTAPWAKRRHGPVNLACLDFVLGTLRLGRDSLPTSPSEYPWMLLKRVHRRVLYILSYGAELSVQFNARLIFVFSLSNMHFFGEDKPSLPLVYCNEDDLLTRDPYLTKKIIIYEILSINH